MIFVTKTFLPPADEYIDAVNGIFERGWITNHGVLAAEIEVKLKEYLQSNDLLFLCNGTVALQIAIKALQLTGNIITTPFSYVATTSSIVWESCTPVFADIDAATFNIDPAKIEALINPDTSGILATHVFGNPCDVEAIEKIAKKHKLKVIYDAAHCFGTTYKGKSIFNYGDISTTSFHATKLFHTAEGGAVFSGNKELVQRMALLRNFGHTSPVSFDGAGINAKNSELHAAMGLAVLKYADELLAKRKEQWLTYHHFFNKSNVGVLQITPGTTYYNGAYFPVVFDSEEKLLTATKALNNAEVYPRRYFYPALNNLNYVAYIHCPVAEKVSACVLCLPLFHELSFAQQENIARLILEDINS